MSTELENTQKNMSQVLGQALDNATSIITKDYLDELQEYEIIKPSEEDLDIDIADCGSFYKLTKFVINKEENFLDKLTTVVNVASSIDSSMVTIIKSNGQEIDYYLGIVSKNARNTTKIDSMRRVANATAFKGAISGNFTGSEINEVPKEEVSAFKKVVLARENSCYASVSGIVSLRNEDNKSIEGYVQGIENLTDSLKGQKYTIVMIADPVETAEIQTVKQGYEMLYTQLSAFAGSVVTYNENDTLSLSNARTEGISRGISEGISQTQSRTKSKGKYHGGSIGIGANIGIPMVAGLSVNAGYNRGRNSSVADTKGTAKTRTETRSNSTSETKTTSSAKTEGKTLQLTYENKSVKSLLEKIDMQLERLDECESFGAFDCAAYVIAESRDTALTVASNYNALMRGRDSSVQASHINLWYDHQETAILGKYMSSLVHPRFWKDKENKIIVSPASIVSGEEIAIQIGLPKKSIPGVTVIPMAPFGRNITEPDSKKIMRLGNLYHMGHDESTEQDIAKELKVKLDIESLSMHTFITGSTGSGKSTAVCSMLDKLLENNVKFMVIEPAKGEYKNRFGSYENVHVYGTNYKKMPLLQINPFSFPEDVHVLEHIDRLIEIFNVCWPMYAAMPAVLKDAIERAYAVAGWNLNTSECRYCDSKGNPLFPMFIDVLNQINRVMDESQYSDDSKGDYKGALCTRLKSLTNGLYSQIFTCDELSGQELFDENVIVDLSRTGSSETKSLIMGLLVMKLQEYRMSNAIGGNESLKHVTVLEEAHNILKRTSTEQVSEGANLQGKSVEMLANSIAEMRTYGEGFIIADQAPGLMDLSVIRNTNTKIILRLPDLEDRELVGRAANLNDDQIEELARLKTFVAAVYQNNWLEPVLCNIDTNFKEVKPYQYSGGKIAEDIKKEIIQYMIMPPKEQEKQDKDYINELCDKLYKVSIPAEAKTTFFRYSTLKYKEDIQKARGQILYHLFNAKDVLDENMKNMSDLELWHQNIISMLQPDISKMELLEQKKIIAVLLQEKMENESNVETKKILDNYIERWC